VHVGLFSPRYRYRFRYGHARCCDDTTGCAGCGLPKSYSCLNPDSQSSFTTLRKFATCKGSVGVGQSYLEIAQDACAGVVEKYYTTGEYTDAGVGAGDEDAVDVDDDGAVAVDDDGNGNIAVE
jgi:hypothetical protein